MKIHIYLLLLFLISASTQSCKNYLNVSEELAGGLGSVEEIFNNPGYTKRWYANVMSGIPDYSSVVITNMSGLDNPWTGMTDELNTGYGDNANYSVFARNANNMSFHRWNALYALIRQANIFLELAKPIVSSGIDADQISEDEFSKLKANVIFMRAYYHYLLFELYGPVPIYTRSFSPKEELDIPRAPVDSVVTFIDSELQKAISLLPQLPIQDEQLRANPTKGVALAVRAKLWMYAASPLFNGGFEEALSVTNNDGNNLFPIYNPDKWTKAFEAAKDLITYANEGNYELYKTSTNGKPDPEKSVYELFQTYNQEVIWATPNTGWGGMKADLLERRTTPRSEPNGLGSTAVLQELVDDFYMKDGLPIRSTKFLKASPIYTENGFNNYNGIKVFNMWLNREPRFYNTVFFSGRKWHMSNQPAYFHVGSANDRSGQSPLSGYLLYKRLNRTVHMRNPGVASVFRPSFIFRLAEFYLLYAEALNEVDPANPDVLKYVNLVRERAGIPSLQLLNPSIAGNQTLQREAIRRESRIELATEGQRYFDVRRWMIADQPEGRQGGDFFGMDMNGNEQSFYVRTKFQTRVFERKQYLYPIPFYEVQKSKKLVQNPGW